jgi:perosamine synthetase
MEIRTPDAGIEAILDRLETVLGAAARPVPLHQPVFQGREWDYVRHCLDTGWVSPAGAFVGRFERLLAEYAGVAEAVAVSSGTAALHIGLLLAGVGRDDEVLMPPLSFVATANAASYLGAVPHFVDIAPDSLGLCPQRLAAHLADIAEPVSGGCRNRRTGRRIAAMTPVHVFGHPADLDALEELSGRYAIPLVEDAAEALGSRYKGRHVGRAGTCAALSFNGNKIVTTGGGGALLTNDTALARKARHLTSTAKLPHPWRYVHDAVGYNYRMPNINAALGCAQMEQLEDFLARKRVLAEAYIRAFRGLPGLQVVREPQGTRSNYWLNALRFTDASGHRREAFLEAAHRKGLLVRPAWDLLSTLPSYVHCPRADLENAVAAAASVVNLPSGADVGPGLWGKDSGPGDQGRTGSGA